MVLEDAALKDYVAEKMSIDPAMVELERVITNRTNVVHKCKLKRKGYSESSHFVIKQYLQHVAKIPSVKMGRVRAHHEYEALKLFRAILGEQAVPETIVFDPNMHLLVLEDVPADHLFEGENDYELFEEEDFLEIGRRLYKIHSSTLGLKNMLNNPVEFTGYDFMRAESAGRVYPREVWDFLEALRLLPKSIIWADCCPKNILKSEGRMVFIDLEFAQYSYPALDLGFFAAHALLYGIKNPQHCDAMVSGIQDLFRGYYGHGDLLLDGVVDMAPGYAGIIMLHKTLSVARYIGYSELENCVVPMAGKLLRGAPVDHDLF